MLTQHTHRRTHTTARAQIGFDLSVLGTRFPVPRSAGPDLADTYLLVRTDAPQLAYGSPVATYNITWDYRDNSNATVRPSTTPYRTHAQPHTRSRTYVPSNTRTRITAHTTETSQVDDQTERQSGGAVGGARLLGQHPHARGHRRLQQHPLPIQRRHRPGTLLNETIFIFYANYN